MFHGNNVTFFFHLLSSLCNLAVISMKELEQAVRLSEMSATGCFPFSKFFTIHSCPAK